MCLQPVSVPGLTKPHGKHKPCLGYTCPPPPTPLVPTSLVFKFAPTARGGVGQGTHHCMFSNSLWLDRLVAFPLPCLCNSLQESRFFEATLQGYSVTFWKARARLKPGPPSTVDAKGGTFSTHVSSFSDTSSLCPCGFERSGLFKVTYLGGSRLGP